MIVRMRFDFSDYERRALAHRYGDKGLATRAQIRAHIHTIVDADWEDPMFDMERDEAPDD